MPKLRSVRAALVPAFIRPHGCADRAFEAGHFVITAIGAASDVPSVLRMNPQEPLPRIDQISMLVVSKLLSIV